MQPQVRRGGEPYAPSPRIPESRGQSLNPHRGMQAPGQEELKETHTEVILEDPGVSTREH